ncbi:hypothetical protein CCACVL1_17311 [Corchorus capsularis]|uniref:Uncharacterized protein n=1 Tax=Corchorus capsularis TaxID=210143 RepID=A0A1R3HT14_COCAP|nr:hypothetical protein CCACVL1_17311 [Corchorus capsularis]
MAYNTSILKQNHETIGHSK